MKLMTPFVTLVVLPALVALGGCAEKEKKVEAELSKPVNCANASEEIKVLRSEKANVATRVLEGATAVYPASAAVGIVAGVESTKVKVATGDYNKAIDERIEEIEEKCGRVP